MKITLDETNRRVVELYEQGLSMATIGDRMGWGRNAKNKVCGIIFRLRRAGLHSEMRGSPIARTIPSDKKQEVLNRLMEGQSVRRVVRETGVSERSVTRFRTTNKLPVFDRSTQVMVPKMATIPTPAQKIIPFPVQPIPTPQPQAVRTPSWATATGSVQCCQYPVGPRLSAVQTYIFCESPDVLPGKPYCRKHARMAYVKPKPKSEKRSQFIDWRKRAV